MADKPHVLLISTDHWPNSLLGVSGHPAIQTPTLDSLAQAGTRSRAATANALSVYQRGRH